MTNDPGTIHDSESAAALQEVYEELWALERNAREVGTPEQLEALERRIGELTERVAALLLQRQLQATLDAQGQLERERELLDAWPGKMKNEGFEEVAHGVSSLSKDNSTFRICIRTRDY